MNRRLPEAKITLRKLQRDDLPWLRNLRNGNRDYFFDTHRISQAQQETWYRTLSYPFFVIEYDGRKAGTVGIKNAAQGNEIHNVLIDGTYRRRGILRRVIDILCARYGLPIYAEVKPSNRDAIKAYGKLGFEPVAYRLERRDKTV
ncbi:GNAT family N-acetyltransferase [Patescibacteria group bacterium]|nr:GNAT family N-acetyltransferase [Patescibacteria group bacterium]